MPAASPTPTAVEDPDEYRMSFGDHLEELRTRLILGLGGYVVAFIFCLMVVRDWVFQFLCRPLLDVMHSYDINPMLLDGTGGDTFSVYLKLSAIAATVIASPWLLWQLWMFVAAGLYPHERKTVTRFIPLFTVLLLGGVAFAYYVVLPMTLNFLLYFTMSVKLPSDYAPLPTTQPLAMALPTVPFLEGDPPQPIANGALWYNRPQSKLKVAVDGRIRTIQYTSENLITPAIQLDEYTDMLLMLVLTFGISFQTPLAVMLLVRVGIADLDELKGLRRIVYFVLVIVAAVITPGDVFTATVALVIPLIGLYELGLILARPPKETETTTLTPPGD